LFKQLKSRTNLPHDKSYKTVKALFFITFQMDVTSIKVRCVKVNYKIINIGDWNGTKSNISTFNFEAIFIK